VVLALAEIVGAGGDDRFRAGLVTAAQRLAAERLAAEPQPASGQGGGLYTGEAGIGAALLRAGQVLDDQTLVDAALARDRYVAALPHGSPDLMGGSAGRLRFHLLLWDETGDEGQRDAAIAAGEALLARVERTADGACRWTIPDGYSALSGTAPLGYARGAAGIADALLDLYEATEDERYLTTAQEAGVWLARLAVPFYSDGRGLNWPELEGESPVTPCWRRGAGGIARFFLHLAALEAMPGAAEITAGAARTVARGSRMTGPTQANGLAGNVEMLLDAYQATGERAYLTEAQTLARLLATFRAERQGVIAWPTEWPESFAPGFLAGSAGIAVCLLRLADSERRPHLLSQRGFRYRPVGKSRVRSRGEEVTMRS
jgi:lantibiotic modifying enzyme